MIGETISLDSMLNHSENYTGEADSVILLSNQRNPLEVVTIAYQLEGTIDPIEHLTGDSAVVEKSSTAKFHVRHSRTRNQKIRRSLLDNKTKWKKLPKFLSEESPFLLKKLVFNEEYLHTYDKEHKSIFSINLRLQSMDLNRADSIEERRKDLYRKMAHLQNYIGYTKMQLQL